jgi:hypothetical protein
MARARDLEKIGETYRKNHDGFLPDRVRKSGRKQRRKALEALGDGIGWLSRLAMQGDKLEFYTVHLKALGLEHFEGEENLYQHDTVNAIKQAILKVMPGTFWARLEVGEKGRKLHVHVLAHQAPTVAYNAQEVQSLQGIAEYLCKCPVPGDNLSAGIFLEARKQAELMGHKRLPKISFSRGISNS